MHLFICDYRIKSEGTNHRHFLWKNDDYSKTEKENKNRRHSFRGKLSDSKLAKFQLNRFRGCRLEVKNVRLTFRNFRSEKTRKTYFWRHLNRNRIIIASYLGHDNSARLTWSRCCRCSSSCINGLSITPTRGTEYVVYMTKFDPYRSRWRK